jgi:uncharacterized protein
VIEQTAIKTDVVSANGAYRPAPDANMSIHDRIGDMSARPDDSQALMYLEHIIELAAHLLPAQGPIPVFIHHNTLHAFEEHSFDEAVKKGARIFGCQPYLSEDRYRLELGRGRIRFDELQEVLRDDLKSRAAIRVINSSSLFDVRLAMLQYRLRSGPQAELLWYMAESNALRKVRSDVSSTVRGRLIAETRHWAMRDLRAGAGRSRKRSGLTALLDNFDEAHVENWREEVWEAFALQALWQVCRDGVVSVPEFGSPPPLPTRHRDWLLQATYVDVDLPVHDLLIRFCAAFVDQGLARWELPRRDEGFFRAFSSLYGRGRLAPDVCLRGLAEELRRLESHGIGPIESVHESLLLLGVAESEWDAFISATLLALRGWGGIIRFLEEREDRVVHPIATGSLIEFLAIRLLLDRLALAHVARSALGYQGPLSGLRDHLQQLSGTRHTSTDEQRALPIFELAQVLGWTPQELLQLDAVGWSGLLCAIEGFSSVERRRIFHLAYERRFYTQTLDAIALHSNQPQPEPAKPRFQAIFCIDEREESIRRHLEETAPEATTLSIAGFFAVAMYYRGAADAHYVPLCPAIARPSHWVAEQVGDEHEEEHQRRTKARRVLGFASHQIHVGSRTFAIGALLSAVLGVLASIPLVARTLFPRLTARIRRMLGAFVSTPPITHLQIERNEPIPGAEGSAIGYSINEMCTIGERVLRDTGLTSNLSRFVLTIGHGSTSMNNPHESAHDCGACGGSRGGPNGRAIAQILNDKRVRAYLGQQGIAIPSDTIFVGGMHNTSNEEMHFFDLHRLPETHRAEFASIRAQVEEACDRDAHERCRRFGSAPLTLSFKAARQHVEGRAEDLAQVRPEWGHATNAICIIGRRMRTRGLFLDRRAFLNSYDPTQDDENSTILTRLLQAAVPVCGGINLEYYFSYVDNPGFGCGTKLPHNITSLIGVMDGAASDLRTGLPWQMVEIHDPVRLLFVIETTPDKILRVMDKHPEIGRPIRNGWVQLAILDPDSSDIQVFREGKMQPYVPRATRLPHAPTSVDWYRGWRDHLEFAVIGNDFRSEFE